MGYNRQNKLTPALNGYYLPNFCEADVFLRLLLVVELFAIVFALVSFEGGSFYVHIALNSVLMLWIGLTSAAVLCWLSRLAMMQNILHATLIAAAVTLLITLIVSLFSISLVENMRLAIGPQDTAYTLLRNLSVSAILIGLALRYFYLQYESKKILEIQAKARLQALQARIRPHFLFNSMNTIASLTHEQPDLAEQAIENLSDLFRASLAAEASIPLQQELELASRYIQIESLRLGDRLTVNWKLSNHEIDASLPALTLQPLIENAIYHGIEPLPEGGTIEIEIVRRDEFIEIVISNPLLEDRTEQQREGNNMAVANIRERLQIAYSGKASMQQLETDERFTVTLKLPVLVTQVQ
ncbi:MAG: sensor histidine kinase [Gammaproteobacteria bacterium]